MFYANPIPRLLEPRRYVVCVVEPHPGATRLDVLYALDAVPTGPDRRETRSWWVCQWYGFAFGWRELWTRRFRRVWVLDQSVKDETDGKTQTKR